MRRLTVAKSQINNENIQQGPAHPQRKPGTKLLDNRKLCGGREVVAKQDAGAKRTGRDLFHFAVGNLRNIQRLTTGNQNVIPPTIVPAEDLSVYDQVEDIDTIVDARVYDHHYAKEIISYMRALEKRRFLPDTYLSDPTLSLTPRSRTIILDWLLQVQHHLRLKQETLYLAVNICDHFIAIKSSIEPKNLQLVIITALLLGSKIEERFAPEIKMLVHLTDNTYTKNEILKMESEILRTLRFDLVMPDPMVFLNRCLQAMKNEDKEFESATLYAMDSILPTVTYVKVSASKLAASAVCLMRKILLQDPNRDWSKILVVYSGYREAELLATMNAMLRELKQVNSAEFEGARKKYSSVRLFNGIAYIDALQPSALINFVLLSE